MLFFIMIAAAITRPLSSPPSWQAWVSGNRWAAPGLLVIAGGGYLIDSIAGLLSPSYTASVSSFTFIGEALFMLWLLLKGRKIALTA